MSGTYNGFLNLWNARTAELVRSLKVSSNPVECVAISPDGQHIASGSFRTIQLWDAKTGKPLRQAQLKERKGTTTGDIVGFDSCSLTFSPDGKRVIWGGELHEEEGQDTSGSALLLWDPAKGNLTPLPDVAESNVEAYAVEAAFSADGTKAVTGRSTSLAVWDTSSWHSTRNIKTKATVQKLAVSPDGKTLVVLEEGDFGLRRRSFLEILGPQVREPDQDFCRPGCCQDIGLEVLPCRQLLSDHLEKCGSENLGPEVVEAAADLEAMRCRRNECRFLLGHEPRVLRYCGWRH